MPTSVLRVGDLRAVGELTHECRDLGDDPHVWWPHWFRRLGRLTDVAAVSGGELAVGPDGVLRELGTVAVGRGVSGWPSRWATDLACLRHGFALRRRLPDHRPRGAAGVAVLARPTCSPSVGLVGEDHTLSCFHAIPGTVGEYSGVVLERADGEPEFSTRQAAVVREAHAAIAPLVGGVLARFADPSPAALPRRVRQVLKCLLEGDSDKQIAARLEISPYTVNQYVKYVFVHFGVNTRAELLARWVRRGWGNRTAWAEED